jgi:hypothetical protein
MPKSVELDLGPERKDVYDAVSKEFVLRNVNGTAQIIISPDTARVVVLAPANGKLARDGTHVLIGGVIVDYNN